jgi:uncharacterized protein YpiB (UPF0302 family)
MFDKGCLDQLVKDIKADYKKDIMGLIDFALDTEDREWFDELMHRMRWVI